MAIDQSDLIWAEDEAIFTARQYLSLCTDESIAYARHWLAKQRVHLHRIFVDTCGLDNAAEVWARYDSILTSKGIDLASLA